MRLFHVLLVGMLGVSPAAAQDSTSSSSNTKESPGQGTSSATLPPAEAADRKAGAKSAELPVSLDHIREGLKRQATDSLLKRTDIPADFRIHIIEQQKIDDMLSKLDFKSGTGPIPAGGIYAYEQQRRLFNPVDHPLAQPYSAFSPGELITIAIENLVARYAGGALLNSLGSAARATAERDAREEVARDVAEYCDRRPDRSELAICTRPLFPPVTNDGR
jgi:hypothetical protein